MLAVIAMASPAHLDGGGFYYTILSQYIPGFFIIIFGVLNASTFDCIFKTDSIISSDDKHGPMAEKMIKIH